MNYSMMFKQICFIVMVHILLCGAVTVAAESDSENQMPDGEGNFLIIYSDRYDESIESSVETIVNMAVAMGKTADYGTVTECMQKIEQYDYLICLGIDNEKELCQQLKEYQGNVLIFGTSFLVQYLEQSGYKGKWKIDSATKGQLSYDFSNNKDYSDIVKLNNLIISNNWTYRSGEIQQGENTVPFCSQIAGIRFIPITEFESKIVKAAVIREVALWLWPYKDAVPDYAQYLVLNEIYPFMDAGILKEKIDLVIEEEVPFIISAMPVMQNGDYPSMKEFCQVLAYAQQNGGAVILHAPLIHKQVEDIEEIYEKLTEMTMTYVNLGVYPIGIEVPYSWLNDEVYLKVLERYRTVFVYDDGKETGFSMQTGTSLFGRQGHQTIMPAINPGEAGENELKCYSSAVYIDGETDTDELTRILDNSRISVAPFMNLWNLNHSVWINNYNIVYADNLLYLNGEQTERQFNPEAYDTNYDYQRRMIQRITLNLQKQNHVLMFIVVIVIIIFTSFIVYARIRNRQQFLYKDKKEE